jgi:hypothetical protein
MSIRPQFLPSKSLPILQSPYHSMLYNLDTDSAINKMHIRGEGNEYNININLGKTDCEYMKWN